MANKKISELTSVITLPDAALITAVDLTRAAGDQNVKIAKSNLITGGGAVDSVNSQTGVVVLDTDDIADTATNRYTNDTDVTRLANTSGTNTGNEEGDRGTITNVIPITNIAGSNYNFNTANGETAYTVTRNNVINQFAQVFINTLTKPTLTLGGVAFTEVGGIGWTASTDLYLVLVDLGVDGIHYSFLPKAVGSGGVDTPSLPDNAVRVLVMTGQSNSKGQALNTDASASELLAQTNTKIWKAGVVDDWEDLLIGTNNVSTSTTHGIELGISRKFLENNPNETLYIIKYADGATNIDDNSPGGTVYDTLLTDYLQPAINNLLTAGKLPYIHLNYSQGESDATFIRYPDFAVKLQSLIEVYRKTLGVDVYFIFNELKSPNGAEAEEKINDIYNAMDVIDSKITTIQSSAYSAPDNTHFDYDSFKLMANDLYDAMILQQGEFIRNSLPYTNIDEINNNYNYQYPSGGSSSLDGLTDVTVTTPSDTEVLTYNGSAWVNSASSGGSSLYLGTWNALTNTPVLDNTDVVADGSYYRVSVAGGEDFGAGNIAFGVDDKVENNGTLWYKSVDNNLVVPALADGDYGHIIVSGGGTVWNLDTGSVNSTAIANGEVKWNDINVSVQAWITQGRMQEYTVATLPASPLDGDRGYVTDALAPTYLGIITGGGAVVCPVFYNGTNWISH